MTDFFGAFSISYILGGIAGEEFPDLRISENISA